MLPIRCHGASIPNSPQRTITPKLLTRLCANIRAHAQLLVTPETAFRPDRYHARCHLSSAQLFADAMILMTYGLIEVPREIREDLEPVLLSPCSCSACS